MARSSSTVLVVEDEVFVAWDVAQALENAGYSVLGPAHTLDDGLRLVDDGVPQAAVLDINLGKETVWPLAERLRANGVAVIFLTADLGHPELGSRFADTRRLSKPVRESDLVQTLAGAMSAR